jgi:hypothetical protein
MPFRIARRAVSAAAAVLLVASGCSGFTEKQLHALATDAEDQYARSRIELLASGNTVAFEQDLDPSIHGAEAEQQIRTMSVALAGRRIEEFQLIGANVAIFNGVPRRNLSYQLRLSGGKWAVANVASRTENGRHVIEGASVTQISEPLEKANAFTLAGKSLAHYVMLVLMVLFPLACVYGAVLVFRMPLRRRWLWLLFCLVGIGRWSLDWTSGASTLTPISLLVLGAGFFRASPYASWTFAVGIPFGALWVIWKYHRGEWRHAPVHPGPVEPADPAVRADAPATPDGPMPVADDGVAEETPVADEDDRHG